MPIEFRCGGCGKLLRTADDSAGKQAKCPDCGTVQMVPLPQPAPPPFEMASVPSPSTGDNPFATPQTLPPMPPQTGSGLATASLVLGCCSLLGWCCPIIGLAISITGLVMGISGLKTSGRSMAIAGIVLNSVGLVLSLVNAAMGAVLAVMNQAH